MDNNVKNALEKIKLSLKNLNVNNINEAQTKDWLIRPFFEALDWDFSNPNEVVPEDDDKAGKRTDYCFYLDKKPKLLIEAKALNNPISDIKMIMEKLNYCTNRGIPLLIITNGEKYKIYFSELKGIGKDKLLKEFSLLDSLDETIINKLSRDSFIKDELLNYAKYISIYTTIKKAFETIITSGNKKLIRLINEEVKTELGHKFGEDDIETALKKFSVNISTDVSDQTEFEKDTKDEKKFYTIENQFKDGKWRLSNKTYTNLVKRLKLMELRFTEDPKKRYINLLADKKSFCQITGLESGLKIWLNLEMRDLSEEEVLKVRDVKNIGHWGMGNIEYYLANGSDIDTIVKLIQKSYEKMLNKK